MIEQIIIFGTGNGAKTAYHYLSKSPMHDVVAFTVDEEFMYFDRFFDKPVVSFDSVEQYYDPQNYKIFILLGFDNLNATRADKYNAAKQKGFTLASFVSPDAHIDDTVTIGENCFILDGQTINPNVQIGDNVVLWSGNHIGDNSKIESHVWISSHVSIGGNARIGKETFVGMNATIFDSVIIGERNIVGAATNIGKNSDNDRVFVTELTSPSEFSSIQFSRILK